MPAIYPMTKNEGFDTGVVVVAHGTTPPDRLLGSLTYDDVTNHQMPEVDSEGFTKLVTEASKLIKERIAKGEHVHVVASGGKRKWTDMLALGDILMREIVRQVGLDMFVPSPGATATIAVEGASKDLYDAAKMSVNLLKKYKDLKCLTVVCGQDTAQKSKDAFDLTMPRCTVDLHRI